MIIIIVIMISLNVESNTRQFQTVTYDGLKFGYHFTLVFEAVTSTDTT